MSQQMSLALARAQGEEGLRQVTEHAERIAPGVTDVMYAFLVKWAMQRERGERFTAEPISDAYAADPCFVQPHDQRCWGGVFQRAVNRGVLRYIDNDGVRRKGHGVKGAKRYVSLVIGKRATEVLS
jgi:hypothetical protein